MDIRNVYDNLLSSNADIVGTSPIQVSGQASVGNTLAHPVAGFIPNRNRKAEFITNQSNTATIYVYTTNAVSSAVFLTMIGPGERWEDTTGGAVPRWIISSAIATPYLLQEYQ